MTWCTIINAVLYWITLEYMDRSARRGFEEYDTNSTTISDFTVKYTIPPGLYEKYL